MGPTRRGFLGTGLGLLGSAALASPARSKATSVILIYNCGGPSHLDLWDPKPDAPADVRGPFAPIPTNVAGIRVSELLPRMAKRADRLAIVRSVHHSHQGHNSAMYWSIVGQPYTIDSTLINPSRTDLPGLGTRVGWLAQKGGRDAGLPPYVITPAPHCDSTAYITPGQFGGVLGPRYDPFVLNADPNAPGFKVQDVALEGGMTTERLQARRALLREVQRRSAPVDTAAAREMDVFGEKAYAMVASGKVQEAFDLSREPEARRRKYGRTSWGQSHLLARRLVEAGVSFVTTVNGPSITWDTHKDNFTQLRDRLVPPMEQAYAALLDDLEERGLLERTLVLWMGDFGRTPLINADAGRDHWPSCYSVVLAGGGVRGGQVIGASDATGSYPAAQPVTPADLHATVLHALGHDPHALSYSLPDGRPMPLSDGQVIRGLL
jgi:hypothetical protein